MQKPGPEGLRSWATSTLPVNSCLPPSHSSSVQQLRDQQGCGDKSDSEISRPPATPVGANVRSAEPETPESTKTEFLHTCSLGAPEALDIWGKADGRQRHPRSLLPLPGRPTPCLQAVSPEGA